MSRLKRLRNWPECLQNMRIDELNRELAYWKSRVAQLGHQQAKKIAEKHLREVERELERRNTTGGDL
jgi:hypothetical protein